MKRLLIFFVITLTLCAPRAAAHCDWVGGPVVASARTALANADVAPVLKWIPAEREQEVRVALTRALAARAAGDDARAVADQWFFETVVRVHRASEGEPFTGLQGEDYRPEPGIALADHALESNSLAELEGALTAALRTELRKRFSATLEAKKHAEHDAAAGRHFVRLYADFVHYVDEVHRRVLASAPAHAH
jgi:hypothetical protein